MAHGRSLIPSWFHPLADAKVLRSMQVGHLEPWSVTMTEPGKKLRDKSMTPLRPITRKRLIRTLQQEDVDPLIAAFCFPWTTPQDTSRKWNLYLEQHQQHLRTVYVLETEGQLRGYASLLKSSEYPAFRAAGIPEVNDLWIAEKHRRKGYGRQLLLHLEKEACSEGFTQIGLGVGLYSDYGAAQRLYCRLGYRPDGRGLTYKYQSVVPGASYPVDDDLLLWFIKRIG